LSRLNLESSGVKASSTQNNFWEGDSLMWSTNSPHFMEPENSLLCWVWGFHSGDCE
jgi:hypothetical protein